VRASTIALRPRRRSSRGLDAGTFGAGPAFVLGEAGPHRFAFHVADIRPWKRRRDVSEKNEFASLGHRARCSSAIQIKSIIFVAKGYSPEVNGRQRAAAWVKDEPFGVEFATIQLGSERLTAEGVAIGTTSTPLPARLLHRDRPRIRHQPTARYELRRGMAPYTRPAT